MNLCMRPYEEKNTSMNRTRIASARMINSDESTTEPVADRWTPLSALARTHPSKTGTEINYADERITRILNSGFNTHPAADQPVLFHSVEPAKIGTGSRYARGSRTFSFVFLLSQRKQLNSACAVLGWRERLSSVDWIAPSTTCLRGLSGQCSILCSRWCSEANHPVLNVCIPV